MENHKLFQFLKKNKYTATIIVIGIIIFYISTFLESVNTLVKDEENYTGRTEEVLIKTTMASYKDPEVQKALTGSSDMLKYEQSLLANELKIFSEDCYIRDFKYDNYVETAYWGFYAMPSFEVHKPIIDVKIINNTSNTIVLDEIEIDVKESKMDETPLIFIVGEGDEPLKLTLVNDGWVKWDNCEVEYSLFKDKQTFKSLTNKPKSFQNRILLPYFEESVQIDLSQALSSKVNDINFLIDAANNDLAATTENIHNFLDALGQFAPTDPEIIEAVPSDNKFRCYVYGKLKIHSPEINKEVFFEGFVALSQATGLGGGLDLYDSYDIALKVEGKNYTVTHPISLYLLPNEAERFFLTISCEKASLHKFKINLNNMNQININSPNVELEYIYPKTYDKELKYQLDNR